MTTQEYSMPCTQTAESRELPQRNVLFRKPVHIHHDPFASALLIRKLLCEALGNLALLWNQVRKPCTMVKNRWCRSTSLRRKRQQPPLANWLSRPRSIHNVHIITLHTEQPVKPSRNGHAAAAAAAAPAAPSIPAPATATHTSQGRSPRQPT